MTDSFDLTSKPLSFSQMTEFLTCRYRWYLKYVLGIRPKVRSTPMEVGDAVHRALAEFLSGGDPADGLAEWYAHAQRQIPFADETFESKLADMHAQASAILERALVGLEDLGFWTFNDPETGQPLVERDWILPLPQWRGGFVVKLDWVAYDPLNKRVWVCDFKTRGYFTSEEDEWANMQNAIYQAAALVKGIESVGTLTFQISSTPPKQPKRNADGGFSRAAVACDWKTYAAAVEAAGLDVADYLDMKPKLEGKEFVKVVPVIRSRESIERVWNEIVEPTADAMIEALEAHQYGYASAEQKTVRFLSPRTCNGCGVRALCHGALKGYGVRALLETDFNAKPQAFAHFRD